MWLLAACVSAELPPSSVQVGGFEHPFQGDMNFGACGCEDYICDIRHLGADVAVRVGTAVFPVADGEVLLVSSSPDWGDGNVAVFVRHLAQEGAFVALYGHIRSDLFAGDHVRRGEPIGVVGPYAFTRPEGEVRGVPHLHFGIHPGAEMPHGPTGQYPDPDCEHPDDTAGWVAPFSYLRTRSP